MKDKAYFSISSYQNRLQITTQASLHKYIKLLSTTNPSGLRPLKRNVSCAVSGNYVIFTYIKHTCLGESLYLLPLKYCSDLFRNSRTTLIFFLPFHVSFSVCFQRIFAAEYHRKFWSNLEVIALSSQQILAYFPCVKQFSTGLTN